MGTYLLISAMQNKYGEDVKIKNVRAVITELKGEFSGGSIATSFTIGEIFSVKEIMASFRPFSLSPIGRPPKFTDQKSILYDERIGGWIGPWVMGNANAAVVCRTYGLLGGKWGEKFSYKEYYNYNTWMKAYVYQIAMGLIRTCLKIPPIRWLFRKFAPTPGEGPSEETLNNGKFRMNIIAETDEKEPKIGSIVVSSDRDIGYLLTGMKYEEFANDSNDVGRDWTDFG